MSVAKARPNTTRTHFCERVSSGTSSSTPTSTRSRRLGWEQRVRAVLADPVPVPEHVADRDGHQHEQHEESHADPVADADAGGIRRHAGRERVHGGREHTGARAEEDDRDRDHPVVPEREREWDEEHEEAERLLPHPVRRAAEREHRHQHRHEQRRTVAEAQREALDAGFDGTGLHRHRDERADGEDEEEDLRRSVEEALFVGAHLAGRDALDAVEPVRRGPPQQAELVRQTAVGAQLALDRVVAVRQLVIAAGDRTAGLGVVLVDPRRDEEGRDPDDQQDDREHGQGGRELEPLRRRLRSTVGFCLADVRLRHQRTPVAGRSAVSDITFWCRAVRGQWL